MWSNYLSLSSIALLLVAGVQARSATGDRVLVVLEHTLPKSQYSSFWSSLESRGFKLTFKGPREEQAPLTEYDEKKFDHLIVFSPSAKSFSNNLKPQSIVSAITSHQINTLFILSSDISEIQRDFAREFDLEFEERETGLIDHFSHLAKSSTEGGEEGGLDFHTNVLLSTKDPYDSELPETIISKQTRSHKGPILYSGIVHSIGSNPFLIPVLHGSPTSYSGEPSIPDIDDVDVIKKSSSILAGSKAGLVTAFQTRGNARVGWIGSERMLRDEAWNGAVTGPEGKAIKTANAAFTQDFTKWIFQETGVLKVISTDHHRLNETTPRNSYRVKEDVSYSISLAQHISHGNTSYWKPFHASDIQLDFTMLDPHIRTVLKETGPVVDEEGVNVGTTYGVDFRCPDRHGVFKFIVEYWRPGFSYIQEATTASVVPFRHNEYPRFIVGAWPFYSGALSVSAAFLLFCVLWVWIGEGKVASKGTKGKKKTE